MSFGVPVQGPVQAISTITSGTFQVNIAAPTQGNTLILLFACSSTIQDPNISNISSANTTWNKAIVEENNVGIWYGAVGANPGAVITVTIANGLAPCLEIVDVYEFPGGLTLDQTAFDPTHSNVSSGITGTTGLTNVAIELAIGAMHGASPLTGYIAQSSSGASPPTNSYTLGDGAEESTTGLYASLGCLILVLSSKQTTSSGVNFAGSAYVYENGCIATFYATSVLLRSIRDVFNRTVVYYRKSVEQPTISDQLGIRKVIFRFITENLSSLQDNFSYVYKAYAVIHHYFRALTENLSSLSESVNRQLRLKRAQLEKLPIQDTSARAIKYNRKLSEIPMVSYIFKRGKATYSRLQKEIVLIQDVASRKINASRKMIETFLIQDVFKRVSKSTRRLIELLSIADALKRVSSYARQMRENISAQDTLKRITQISRSQIEKILFSDVFNRKIKYSRKMQESIIVTDNFNRTVKNLRLFIEKTIIQDISGYTSSRIFHHYIQIFVENVIISEAFNRFTKLTRKITEDLSTTSDYFTYFYRKKINDFIYNFIEDLSSISENLVRIVTIQDIIDELNSLLTKANIALTNLEIQIKKKFARFKLGR